LAAFSSAGCETPKVGFVRVRLAGNCQRLALVSVGLHFKSPTGAGWPCPWQAVSVAKIDGFGFGSGVGGRIWDGHLAASESWAEVSLREFEFWLKPKGELVVEFSQVFENRSVFISRPTQRAADWWDSAAFSSIFLASSFFCSQAESTPAHTQVTQTVGLQNNVKLAIFKICQVIYEDVV